MQAVQSKAKKRDGKSQADVETEKPAARVKEESEQPAGQNKIADRDKNLSSAANNPDTLKPEPKKKGPERGDFKPLAKS